MAVKEVAEVAKKQADKVKEVKKAQEKVERKVRDLNHATKVDHLVRSNANELKSAARDLEKKKKELDRLS